MAINWSNVIWLAQRHIRDTWSSFILTPIYFAFMGAVLALDESYSVEFAHPILMLILIQPALSARYMTWKQDNDVTRHQEFLRSLPLGFGTIITSRLISMLVAGAINVPVYFVWFWFYGYSWDSFGAFLAWVTFWVGVAMAGAGFALVQEFWLTLRSWTVLNFAIIFGLLGLALLVFWRTDLLPVEQTMELSDSQPLLLAILGIAIGIASLGAAVAIAIRFFRQREYAQ